jgi:S-(hydroxymethyl)glutathione dehydrogenase/alcohol dehydrogenase
VKSTAAILVELNKPLEIVELELPVLKPGQLLVEVTYSGVCHTQILECRGYRGEDKFLPHCLGHEGSGIVLETGPGVTKVKEGQRVILSWMKATGRDVPGSLYRWNGRNVNAGAITTFGTRMVISENRVSLMPDEIMPDQAAMLGCAVPTGLGVIFNTARPMPGQSIAVFGAGGIGLCAIAGASIAGCWPVIAVDLNPLKLEAAMRMGASNCISSVEENVFERLKQICPAGLDFAIEATGRPEVMSLALAVVRQQGGKAIIVGNARQGEKLALDPQEFNMGKQLLGTWGGDNLPDQHFPRYCRLLTSRRLNLDPLLSRTYPLEQVNQAIDDLEHGRVVRPLVQISAT